MSRRHDIKDLFYDYHRKRRVEYAICAKQKAHVEPSQRGTVKERKYVRAGNLPRHGVSNVSPVVTIRDVKRIVNTKLLKDVLGIRNVGVNTLRWSYAVVIECNSKQCRIDVYHLNDDRLLIVENIHAGNLYDVRCPSIPVKDARQIGAWGESRPAKEKLIAACKFRGTKPDFRWV